MQDNVQYSANDITLLHIIPYVEVDGDCSNNQHLLQEVGKTPFQYKTHTFY